VWTKSENRLYVCVHNFSVPSPLPVTPLEEGQIWMMPDRSLEVKRVGKHLVEFRLMKRAEPGAPVSPRPRAASKLESIKTVLAFLKANKAVLEPAA